MPPELQMFRQRFGRLPVDEFELNAFLSSQTPSVSAPSGMIPPGVGLSLGAQGIPVMSVPSGIEGVPPTIEPGPIFGPPQGSVGGGGFPQGREGVIRTFQRDEQPSFPDALRRRGQGGIIPPPHTGPGGTGPGPIESPPMGAPGGAPLPPERAAVPTQDTTASSLAGILGRLDNLERMLPQTVARARLGGGGGASFSFPRSTAPNLNAGTIAPAFVGGFQAGGLPAVGPTGSGEMLRQLGLQQQMDVQNQRDNAAAVMSSLIGLGGGIGGAAI